MAGAPGLEERGPAGGGAALRRARRRRARAYIRGRPRPSQTRRMILPLAPPECSITCGPHMICIHLAVPRRATKQRIARCISHVSLHRVRDGVRAQRVVS